VTNVSKIEVELQKTIDMIEEQEIILPNAMLERKNVQPNVEIDGGDILNFTSCNYLPHPSFQVEKMGGVFFVEIFVAIPSLIMVLKPLHHLPSPCERVGGAFFWGSII